MRVKISSWTLWFNLGLIMGGIASLYFLDKEKSYMGEILLTNGIIGLGLRLKTKDPLLQRKDS